MITVPELIKIMRDLVGPEAADWDFDDRALGDFMPLFQAIYAAGVGSRKLSHKQKTDIATNWFTEEWAVTKAVLMLEEYDTAQVSDE